MKVSFTNFGKQNTDPNLTDPMMPARVDICPFCKAQRIELFSFNGYAQNYKYAVDEFMKGNLISYDQYEIRTMKCRACNKEFVIDWKAGMPVPLRDTSRTSIFLQEFIAGI